MADILCLVGAVGSVISILLILILSLMKKNAYPALGVFALCVLAILGSGFLPSSENKPSKQANNQINDSTDTVSSVKEDMDQHKPEQEQETEPISEPSADTIPVSANTPDGVYRIGDTWTVPGQWSVTVTGVTETSDRNQYSSKTPEAVYILDYTYTNLGYEEKYSDGIFISLGGLGTIVDSQGIMAYDYPGDVDKHPVETPIGATCYAQSCIGVDNAGNFKIIYSTYDGNSDRQTATFEIDVN